MYSSVVISSPSRFSSTLSQSWFLRPCPRAIVICYDAPLMYSLFLLRPLPVCRLSFSHIRYISRRFISFWHTHFLFRSFSISSFFYFLLSPLLSIFSVSFLFSLFFLFSFFLSLFFLPLFFSFLLFFLSFLFSFSFTSFFIFSFFSSPSFFFFPFSFSPFPLFSFSPLFSRFPSFSPSTCSSRIHRMWVDSLFEEKKNARGNNISLTCTLHS